MAGDCKLVNKLHPKLLNYLMPFQKSGVQFAIEKNGKCLIADEMGLGKTVQAIAVAYYYREDWPMLVIMPSSLRYAWLEELEKWLPDIHPHDFNLIQGGTDASGISTARVSLVTFGLLSSPSSVVVKEALMNQKFKVVIVDESHYIRNFRTACAQSVVPLVKQAERRILLSGTPALARPVELYPQLEAICPGRFGNWWEFTSRYCDAKIQYFGKQRKRKVDGASNLDELQSRLTTEVMIRREKKDVLTQLPPKQRQRVLFELKDSSLKTEILDTFDELQPHLSRAGPDLSNASSIDVKVNDKRKNNRVHKNKSREGTLKMDLSGEMSQREIVSTSVTESPQISQEKSSSLVLGETRVTMLSLISKLYKLTGEAKIGPVKEYVSLLCENPNLKFLVFAYHHCMMDGIQQTLWEKKVPFIRIDGNTKPSERLYFVQKYQGDPECRVAILSILAAGVGLTFTAAKLVVFAEMYWTPGVMVQCEDRAHRIGQTSCVAIHYLVAKGTMDEWVWSAVCKKTTVVTATLNGRVQTLEAAAGDKYQVEVLSNAEAWVPSDSPTVCDITSMFLSQQPANQSSIKDFFASSQCGSTPKFSPKISTRLQSVTKACLSPSKSKISSQEDGLPLIITLSDNEDIDAVETISSKKVVTKMSEDSTKIIVNTSKRKRVSEKFAKHQKSKRGKFNTSSSSHSTKGHKSVIKRLQIEDTDSTDFKDGDISDYRTGLKCIPNLKTNHSDKILRGDYIEELPTLGSTNVPSCSPLGPFKHIKGNRKDFGDATNDGTIKSDVGELNVTTKWPCCVCTFLNHTSLSYCEMCDTPKKKTRKLGQSNRDKRIRPKRNVAQSTSTNAFPSSHEIDFLNDDSNYVKIVDSTVEGDSTESGTVTTEFSDSGIDIISNEPIKIQKSEQMKVDAPHCTLSQNVDQKQSSNVNYNENKSGENTVDFFRMLTKLKEDISSHLKDDTGEKCNNMKCSQEKQFEGEETFSNINEIVKEDQGQIMSQDQNSEDLCDEYDDIKCDQIDHTDNADSIYQTGGGKRTEKYVEYVEMGDYKDHEANDPFKEVELDDLSNQAEMKGEHYICKNNTNPPKSSEDDNISNKEITFKDQKEAPVTNENVRELDSFRRRTNANLDDDASAALTIFGSDNEMSELSENDASDWLCGDCNIINSASEYHCDGCLSSKPTDTEKSAQLEEGRTEKREINLDKIPVYSSFHYCCSRHTGRIYLFDKDKQPLNVNFLPLDVSVGNTDGLPDLLLHPDNMRVVRRFIQEWKSLSETKRRYLSRHTDLFDNPRVAYDRLKAGKPNYCINRHLTKESVSLAAVETADRLKGNVRVIKRPQNKATNVDEIIGEGQGSAQVLNKEGIPLCMNCEKPYQNELLKESTIKRSENAWYLRFCSHQCSHTYWMKTHNDYARDQIFEVEHGVCQLCGIDAHTIYRQIKDTPSPEKCASILKKTVYNKLSANQKSRMVKHCTPGLFWHVDHIIPVWEGGGECDIDNLRTLCTPCHQSVTAEQTHRRNRAKKLGDAAGCRDITGFFKPS